MKTIISALLLTFSLVSTNAYSLKEWHREPVENLIYTFSKDDKQTIADLVNYPLRRQAPLEPVKNSSDMLKRFDEVFDKKIISRITNSDINADWSSMGSEIMFGNGDIWLTEDGLIKAVNYQSKIEASLINMMNSSSKDELHTSLKKYEQPVLLWETKKFMIRVDYLGKSTYRYASWSLPAIVSDKPDLILKGHREIGGTARNTEYIFERGNYKYICSITNVGHKDALPLALQVFLHDKIILEQLILKERYRSYIAQQTVKDINREELSLKESINEMILLVEQDNAKEFFEEWMEPKLYQPYKDTDKIELAIQNGFGSRKQGILKALNISYAQTPDSDKHLDVKNNIVRFHVGKKDVVYKKVHGRWRFGSR